MTIFAILAATALQAGAAVAPADTPTESAAYDDCVRMSSAQPERVKALAKEWIAQDGGAAARHCLGLAQLHGGEPLVAAATFAEAARLTESSGERYAAALYTQAGNAALLAEDAAAAEGYFDQALTTAERDDAGVEPAERSDILIDRARARTELNKLDLARADLFAATQAGPDNMPAWLLLAAAERRAGNLTGAESAIAEAVRLAPNDPDVKREAGLIAASEG